MDFCVSFIKKINNIKRIKGLTNQNLPIVSTLNSNVITGSRKKFFLKTIDFV